MLEKNNKKSEPRLKKFYNETVVPALMKKFNYTSVMQAPRIKKITINMGVGEGASDKKVVDAAVKDLTLIAGQKPVITLSRKSIAGFKIRENWPIGCKVTLRGQRMYELFDRLVNIVIPRIRDFRGLNPQAFDGRGNYTFGLQEQIVFPEIKYDEIDQIRGMDITITTSARTDSEAHHLLSQFKFPFKEIRHG